MAEDPRDWEIETRAVRGGMARSGYGEISEALFLTQSFAYPNAEAADRRFGGEPGFIYQRFANPTTAMFEERLALMEGAEMCRATASGMAAVNVSLTGLVRAGDHIVAGRALFGSSRWILSNLMPRFGVETTYVDAPDLEAWRAAMRPNTKVLLVESPASSILNVGSIAGRTAYEGGSVYCAAKAGELQITRALRLELSGTGVRVATIDPGMAETEFSLVRFKGDESRAKKVYEGLMPLTAEDVAETLVWVASRPPHVCIDELVIKPTDQAAIHKVHRRPTP